MTLIFLLIELYNPEKYHSDCIDTKVCEHMCEPRGVYRFAFIVENIENNSADEQTEKGEQKYSYIEISRGHSAVINGKHKCTEYIRKQTGCVFLQYNKAEPPEEDLLEQGIDYRYVNRDVNEVFFADTCVGGKLSGYNGKVDLSPEKKICAEKKCEDRNAYAEPFGDIPFLWCEELL